LPKRGSFKEIKVLGAFEDLVPHSQCSLRENPKFLQNFGPKNNTLKGNSILLFSFNNYHSILGLTIKGKNYSFLSQSCVY
jgi:hypothetical protein